MYENYSNKKAYLAIGSSLPQVGKVYKCISIVFETQDNLHQTELEVIPKAIEIETNNLVRIETDNYEVFFVIFPSLEPSEVRFATFKTLPYLDSYFKCNILETFFDTLWNPSLNWKRHCSSKIIKIQRFTESLYGIKTDNTLYLALKI